MLIVNKAAVAHEATNSHVRHHLATRKQVLSQDLVQHLLVSAAGALPWEWDLDIDAFRWAAPPEWLFGRALRPDQGLREIVHPTDRERFIAAVFLAKERASSFALELCLQLDESTMIDCLVRGFSTADAGDTSVVNGVVIELAKRPKIRPELEFVKTNHRQTLLDNLADAAWLKNTRGILLAANSAFCKRYDFDQAAVVGKSEFDLFPREKASQLRNEDSEVMSSRTPMTYESAQDIDGRSCWIEVVKAPVFDEEGNLLGSQSTLRDISTRKISERQLQESERRFRMLAEMSSDWYWEQNADLRFTSISNRINSQIDSRTAIGKTCWELNVEDVTLEQWNKHREALKARLPFSNFEYTWIQPNGARRRIINSGKPVYDDSGKFMGYRGIGADVTERRTMETSLRRALERSEVLLETTPTATALVRDYCFVHCNPAMDRLFGYATGELLGRKTDVLYAGVEDWLQAEESVSNAIANSTTFSEQVEFVRANGEHFWAVAAARPLEQGTSDVLYTFTDVTAQQNIMRALTRAKEMSDAASESKSGFLATMSHEIRTPMNGVLGMLELLDLTDLNKDQRESLGVARDSAIALLRLIDDILDFSKIEAGQVEIKAEPTALVSVVNRVIAVFTELATRKGLLLEHRVDPLLWPVHMIDGFRLTQILNNLLSNAVKFTARGRITLSVESIERDLDTELIRLSVRDTGIGVPLEQQAQLFRPFVQADSNTTRKYGGTGLGLSICRHLAEMMGGNIELESEPGNGTTMTVRLRLPLSHVPAVAIENNSRQERLTENTRASADTETVLTTILIADDHPINLRLIERQVSLLGFDTELARDGLEALEKWKTGKYRLLLTDCHMPNMDGYQLSTEIRRLEELAATSMPTAIIACTADAFASNAELCAKSGMDDYISKPTTLAALKEKIEQWLQPASIDNSAPADTVNANEVEVAEPSPSVALPIVTRIMPAAPDLMDPEVLAEFTGGDESLRREILLQFIAADDADAANLREKFGNTDLEGIAQVSHRIKGASNMIGAKPYARAAERLNRGARTGDLVEVEAGIVEFEYQRELLNQLLQEATAPG